MEPVEHHEFPADATFDGGEMDCGGGLLVWIRKHMDRLSVGQLLEIRSTEISVDQDLPAWCRLTGNELMSWTRQGKERSFLVCKGKRLEAANPSTTATGDRPTRRGAAAVNNPESVKTNTPGAPRPAVRFEPAPIPPLAAFGVGSWPRPAWLLRGLRERLAGRIPEAEFERTADDAVRLAVAAQERAGVDVVTDGEQRRDSYANFVGHRLEGCESIPLTDLLALVDDPESLAAEMESLDVPAAQVRHPVVLSALRRARPLAAHEAAFVMTLTARPVKVAVPGPYLLTRILWIECIRREVYASRAALAADVVGILRQEIAELLGLGVSLVQIDEPVLTEVVFKGGQKRRSFMCGALSGRGDAREELAFAEDLLDRALAGFPRERLALHVCRGNWTPDESAALTGDYAPLLPILTRAPVGTLLLELCTPRAGELEVLTSLPSEKRVGVGVVNPKAPRLETAEEIRRRAERAIRCFGRERVLLVPDCGFATFAENPVCDPALAEAKLSALAAASRELRGS